MKIYSTIYRRKTELTLKQARELAPSLCGGDEGLIIIIFDSKEEKEQFELENPDIEDEDEWRLRIGE